MGKVSFLVCVAVALLLAACTFSNSYAATGDFTLGKQLAEQGNTESAINYLERAAKQDPSNAEIHQLLGDCYRDQSEWDQAIEHYQEALNLRKGYLDAMTGIAEAYSAKGDADNAIAMYEQALQLSPNNDEILIALGDVYKYLKNDSETADTYYKRAVAVNPSAAQEITLAPDER